MSTKESKARSISDRLSSLSKKMKVAFPTLLTQFLIERLASRLLTDRELSANLIFKGGYVGLRVYKSPRYTIDLDALLRKGDLVKMVPQIQVCVEKDMDDGVWFRMDKTAQLETQGDYGGQRIAFRCGTGEILKDIKRAKLINLDIGKGDPVTPGAVEASTPYLLGNGELSWLVYPIETTVAEKLHALVVRGSENSRAKDIFDLNLFLPKCNTELLKQALKATFKYRQSELPVNLAGYIEKIDLKLLRMGWKSAVGEIDEVGEIEVVFSELVKQLRKVE